MTLLRPALIATLFSAALVFASGPGPALAQVKKDNGKPSAEQVKKALQTCITHATTPPKDRIQACDLVLSLDFLEKDDHAMMLGFRGAAKQELFDYSGALRDFTEAHQMVPNNLGYLVHRAEALSRLGKNDAALEDLDLAIQIAPTVPNLFVRRAIVFSQLKNRDAAYRDLKAALDLDPKDIDALSTQARMYIQDNKYPEAEKTLDTAIDAYPDVGQLYSQRGLSHMAQKAFDKALSDLNKAIELEGPQVDTLMMRASIYRSEDKPDLAVEDYGRVLDIDPTVASAWYERGVIHMLEHDFAESRDDLTVATQLAPSADYLNTMAWLLVSATNPADRDPEEAEDLVKRSLDYEVNADNTDTAAAVYVLLGNVDKAYDFYLQSMELGGEERIRLYQSYMAERGQFDGKVDGVDGPQTRAAIRDFAKTGQVLLAE